MPADVIEYTVYGDDLQLVEVHLDPGETVRAEAGAMTYMTQGIKMQTNTGGVWSGFKRMLTGEGFFITNFTNEGDKLASVAFSAPYPGKIVPIDLKKFGGEFYCQKESFLCAAYGIEIDISFTKKIGAGFFGGEGFVLQKLSGDGLAFAHAGGTVIEKCLEEGEVLRVDAGCIVGFESSVKYDIDFVGGFRNALFGGEGLFFAEMHGPGWVLIQNMPFSRLADRIGMALERKKGTEEEKKKE
jgi:uncharacterized protein (TIGR00266 family)